ncbi:MAG: transposase, partial [Desulfotomaculum sp.]|nr:transposase [Desulfotomaculum sp.]
DNSDKHYLLKKIFDYKVRMGFTLYGYVIMGNHYHFILKTLDEPLSKIMHALNNCYSKYYNLTRHRTGHVFEARYKAILVQDEKYLLNLVRYVHQNPLRAGMCKYVWQYRWSSDVYYRENLDEFVDINLLLDIISKDRAAAIEKYKEFMSFIEKNDYDNAEVIGDDAFEMATAPHKQVITRKRLDEILIETGVSMEDFKLIKNGSRKRHLVKYKVLYIQEALKHNYTYKETAGNIGISDAAAHKLLEKHGIKGNK